MLYSLGTNTFLEDLRKIEPKAREVYRRYLDKLDDADVRELAIHRRVSKLNYSRRCAEASAMQSHMKQGLPLAPGMDIGYVVKDAHKWEVDPGEQNMSSMQSTIEGCLRSLGEKLRLFLGASDCQRSVSLINLSTILQDKVRV